MILNHSNEIFVTDLIKLKYNYNYYDLLRVNSFLHILKAYMHMHRKATSLF